MSDVSFSIPKKCIRSQDDIEFFLKSEAFRRLMAFIDGLSNSITGKPIGTTPVDSKVISDLQRMLCQFTSYLQEFPPVHQPMRFGNKAFRSWLDKVESQAENSLKEALPEYIHAAVPELLPYLTGSFGDRMRIDYGTGHELSFLAFLCCLFNLDIIKKEDFSNVVSSLLVSYLKLTRRLQTEYVLEPAGSKGVWGLDDYQFFPFLFGSAQLIDNTDGISPSSILDMDKVDRFSDKYMYLSAIQFIHRLKTGPFAEHSPTLHSIANVATWHKVNAGLRKMYVAEVLCKLPIIQHFFFGTILPFEATVNDSK